MKEILGTGAIIIGALLTCMFGLWLSYVISMAWFSLLVIGAIVFVIVGTCLHVRDWYHARIYGTPEEQAEARYQAALKKYYEELKACNARNAPVREYPYPPSRCEFK